MLFPQFLAEQLKIYFGVNVALCGARFPFFSWRILTWYYLVLDLVRWQILSSEHVIHLFFFVICQKYLVSNTLQEYIAIQKDLWYNLSMGLLSDVMECMYGQADVANYYHNISLLCYFVFFNSKSFYMCMINNWWYRITIFESSTSKGY